MGETVWNLRKVKHLKKKQLVLYNLLMLFIAFLAFYIENDWSIYVLAGLTLVMSWSIIANMVYTLKTGKVLGTKASRRVQAFDRDYLGEKRWKKRKQIGTVIMILFSIGFTAFLLNIDLNSMDMDFPTDALPLFGAWGGFNAGEINRVRKLQ
ncbi:hypothetical protein H0266_11015 [Halobacillus locisalis]|uniref:Uncharacterized protein n=1 Tax=Halobacillus locisalis TaxID=220753 RepID=A0A838CUH0_9BACI|nr:hypothetical protein [Halobacillus locisalis]MBA2175425.1 hypothetical protein [Halobacillus locisalis]